MGQPASCPLNFTPPACLLGCYQGVANSKKLHWHWLLWVPCHRLVRAPPTAPSWDAETGSTPKPLKGDPELWDAGTQV